MEIIINKAIADAIFNLKNGSISLLLNLQVKEAVNKFPKTRAESQF